MHGSEVNVLKRTDFVSKRLAYYRMLNRVGDGHRNLAGWNMSQRVFRNQSSQPRQTMMTSA